MSSSTIERLLVNEVKETMNTPAYGTSTFSTTDSCTFYINYNPGTTINLTNVQLANDGIIGVSFISPLGTMATPTTLTINGTTYVIKWSGGSIPANTSNSINLLGLSIITINGAVAHVIGGKANFA